MLQEDSTQLEKDIKNFLSEHQTKYKLFLNLKDNLVNLTEETYQDMIQLIQDNKEIFFKDHSNATFLYFNIILFAEYYFKNLELYLDICVHFQSDLKEAGLTENQMIVMLFRFHNAINYLFSKNFFSIESIIEISFTKDFIFVNFLPEIEEYDSEYCKKREEYIISNGEKDIIEFYNSIKNDRQTHFLNRSLNYHPSHLHKIIREDDVIEFQSFISKNNFDVNHKIKFSYYERSHTINDELSLIKTAAIYGSINIFKYLWFQNDIVINDDLILFAYFGQNFDIIHICEKKCYDNETISQPILIYRQDLLNYYLDNFEDKIEEDQIEIESGLKNFKETENNPYKKLNSNGISSSLFSFYYDIIESCFPKIIYILRNIKMQSSSDEMDFLISARFESDLFKFLYSKRTKNSNINLEKKHILYLIKKCLKHGGNDAFKICFDDVKDDQEKIRELLNNSLIENHDFANYLIDLQISGTITNIVAENCLLLAIRNYNENIVVKLFKLISFEHTYYDISIIVTELLYFLSVKMICSLFNNLKFLPKNTLLIFSDLFSNNGYPQIQNHILQITKQ